VTLAMTRQERERFLTDVHVAVLSIPEEGRGPLTVPVWYAYEAGELRFVTGRTSRKGRLLEQARRISLCAQTETTPYRYVSIEGPIVAIQAADVERDLRPLARRYLGDEGGDAYVAETAEDLTDSVLVRVRPERWLTVDYAKE
jgi:nitroimidazol reductase NimA-like FMN-containing flavoprotein (pyridoxamine 5'-phosphate oxidase superfamily)